MNAQRSFLRCQFSAVACKRQLSNLDEDQNTLSIAQKNNLLTCIHRNKSISGTNYQHRSFAPVRNNVGCQHFLNGSEIICIFL